MSVRIRLKMMGRKNHPTFRIVAIESTQQRDGRVIERLGWYNPHVEADDKKTFVKVDRAQYWIQHGGVVSETVNSIFVKHGIESNEQRAHKQRLKRNAKIKARKAKKRAAAGKVKGGKAKAKGAAKAEAPKAEAPKAETPKASKAKATKGKKKA